MRCSLEIKLYLYTLSTIYVVTKVFDYSNPKSSSKLNPSILLSDTLKHK